MSFGQCNRCKCYVGAAEFNVGREALDGLCQDCAAKNLAELRQRAEAAERERDDARETCGLKLAACDCAAMLDTPESHEKNKSVTRDNPAWSPAFDSVMRRTQECLVLRAEVERLKEENEKFRANNRYQRGYHDGEQSALASAIRAMKGGAK